VTLTSGSDQIHAGSPCPFTISKNGFSCLDRADQTKAVTVSTIPSSGLICPGKDNGAYDSRRMYRYYNGCYDSVAIQTVVSSGRNASCSGRANCSCSGSGSRTTCSVTAYTHHWIVNDHATWTGCIMDRAQDADTRDTSTDGAGYPAVNQGRDSNDSYNCPIASAMGLSSNWTTLKSKVSSMIAAGGTNQTIGLAHAMETMTASGAFGAGTLPTNTARYIILLSDGLNTIDRWYGNGSSHSDDVDDRMALACQHAKDQKIIVYTIMVDPGGAIGDSEILQACASDSSKYYHLTTAGAIIDTFNQIAQQITNVRVSR
jgi:hypothetical protein